MTRVLASILVVICAGLPAAAQATRAIAVADFVDESSDGPAIAASQLNAVLAVLIAQRAAGRLRVVPTADVRAAMRSRGLAPHDLVSPMRAAEVASAVGADLIVTGRWTHLDADRRREEMIFDPGFGQAVLEVRVLEAASRRIVLREAFQGVSGGGGRLGLLTRAAFDALSRAAIRLSQL